MGEEARDCFRVLRLLEGKEGEGSKEGKQRRRGCTGGVKYSLMFGILGGISALFASPFGKKIGVGGVCV